MKTASYLIIYPLALVVVLWAGPVLGQDDNNLAKIKFFESGNYDIELSAASMALFGPGGAGLRTSVAPVFPGPGRHLHNPALPAMCSRPVLVVDYSPHLTLDLGSMLDLDSKINDALDESMADHMTDDGTITEAGSDASIVHPDGISSAAMIIPLGYFSVAFSFDRALNVDLRTLATGLQAWADIEKEVGDDVEVVRMRTDIDISAHFRMQMQRYSLAFSSHPLPMVWTGVGLDWLHGRGRISALADVEGLMSTGGREFVFGDPNDPWENSLDQSIQGDYLGDTWTLRLGGGWQATRRFSLGASLNLGHKLSMKGDTDLILHRLCAYDEDDGINPADLSLSSPTETELIDSPVDDSLEIEFPGSMTLGLAMRTGPLTSTFDYQAYWGDFSLEYLDARFHLHPRHMVKLGLYSSHFSLSLGGMLCSPEYHSSDDDWDSALLPIPLLAFGGGGRIGRHLTLDLITQVLPAPSLKISTGINF